MGPLPPQFGTRPSENCGSVSPGRVIFAYPRLEGSLGPAGFRFVTKLAPLLDQLGDNLGLPGLAPDESGLCMLTFDDLAVNLQQVPDREEAIVFSRIGTLPADASPAVLRALLAANLFWTDTRGLTLSLEPGDGAVIAAERLALGGVAFPQFRRDLERFVRVAEVWRLEVANLLAEKPAPPDEHPLVTGSPFTRV